MDLSNKFLSLIVIKILYETCLEWHEQIYGILIQKIVTIY